MWHFCGLERNPLVCGARTVDLRRVEIVTARHKVRLARRKHGGVLGGDQVVHHERLAEAVLTHHWQLRRVDWSILSRRWNRKCRRLAIRVVARECDTRRQRAGGWLVEADWLVAQSV